MNADVRKTNNYFLYLLIINILSLLHCSCNTHLEQSELYGTYVGDYDIVTIKLILYRDNTYLQEVTLKATKKADYAKGHWNYKPDGCGISGEIWFDENYLLVLDGFGRLIPDYANPKKRTIGIECVEKLFGSFYIGDGEIIRLNKIR